MSLLDHELVLEVIAKIPHQRYQTALGEIYVFRLTDFTRAVFGDVNPGELKAFSRMIAAELREMGAIITRQHDHRRVMFFYREKAASMPKRGKRKKRKRRKTRIR